MTSPSMDARDFGKEPPAELDVNTIIKARRWLLTQEGWEELKARREKTDWTPVGEN